MARFFRTSSGRTRARAVGVLAACFATWDLWAIAMAAIIWWRALVAIGLYTLSIGLFTWAVRACRQHPPTAIFETDVPTYFVDRGPYQYVRHPFYATYILFWLASWVASNSWAALVSLIVMSAIYVHGAREEEAKFRASAFAAAYAQYRRRTGFLTPRLGREQRR